jgi:ABC-type multidrug transport system ATPase subunit
MEATIEVRGLCKRFGPVLALDGMSFTVRPGHVTGFVGPNGAGKSTTMRVILGLDAPDAGTAVIGGRPYHSLRRPLTHVGALLDAAALQPSRSARNHLLWLAHSQGLTAGRVDEVVAQSGLQAVVRRKAGGYSLGMRQRLGIAAALLGDAPVLMLDEPFNGMDPEGIVWMRGFLRSLAAQGRAVLVSGLPAEHGLLYLFPVIAAAVSNPHWQRHLEQIAPMSAGLAIQATTGLRGMPVSPWAGLAVLAAWAAGAMLASGLLLRLRDA